MVSRPVEVTRPKKPQPVLIAMSVLAALDVAVAGVALSDLIGERAVGLLVLALAAVKAGVAYYLHGVVVPLDDTAAYLDPAGRQIAGPAASVPDGREVIVSEAHHWG